MNARVIEEQADLFEVGILSQTVEVLPVSFDRLLGTPAGPPLVVVGGFLAADRLSDLRRLSVTLGRAGTAVVVVPPFSDLDIGRYFETPVPLRLQRRSPDATAHVVDAAAASAIGEAVKVRSDHFFNTALAAGVLALDQQGKPTLIRYQSSNTAGPVYFSALQLLTYTALTDESDRQGLLIHLLSWVPSVSADASTATKPVGPTITANTASVSDGVLLPVALLLAAGGSRSSEQLRALATEVIGADLDVDSVGQAVQELALRGLLNREGAAGAPLHEFLEERGMHPYLRELTYLLSSQETGI